MLVVGLVAFWDRSCTKSKKKGEDRRGGEGEERREGKRRKGKKREEKRRRKTVELEILQQLNYQVDEYEVGGAHEILHLQERVWKPLLLRKSAVSK